jgi:hypothetical protein
MGSTSSSSGMSSGNSERIASRLSDKLRDIKIRIPYPVERVPPLTKLREDQSKKDESKKETVS